ncbi:MAG: glycosyltransferase family 4 protein [Burkholderiales bacterium]
MKNVCFIVSSPMTAKVFLRGHIDALSQNRHVDLIANFGNNPPEDFGADVRTIDIPIRRDMSTLQDLLALMGLIKAFLRIRYDVIHSLTPKAGFLAMIAGFLARIPIRIHTFTGQIWVTRTGVARQALKYADKLLALFATRILVDSPSQKKFLIEQGVITAEKSTVLAKGSVCGIDTARFRPDPAERTAIRAALGIPDNDLVFLYLGRLNYDKGILDLAHAFSTLCDDHASIHLMIAGPDEERIKPKVQDICSGHPERLHMVDYTDTPERYMAAADVFCLPSYREGFGSVIIEAASVGIPAIGSRIYGITDAIEENVTGLLHPAGNVEELCNAMSRLILDPVLRKSLGETARIRAGNDFAKETLTRALLDYYQKLLGIP